MIKFLTHRKNETRQTDIKFRLRIFIFDNQLAQDVWKADLGKYHYDCASVTPRRKWQRNWLMRNFILFDANGDWWEENNVSSNLRYITLLNFTYVSK